MINRITDHVTLLRPKSILVTSKITHYVFTARANCLCRLWKFAVYSQHHTNPIQAVVIVLVFKLHIYYLHALGLNAFIHRRKYTKH